MHGSRTPATQAEEIRSGNDGRTQRPVRSGILRTHRNVPPPRSASLRPVSTSAMHGNQYDKPPVPAQARQDAGIRQRAFMRRSGKGRVGIRAQEPFTRTACSTADKARRARSRTAAGYVRSCAPRLETAPFSAEPTQRTARSANRCRKQTALPEKPQLPDRNRYTRSTRSYPGLFPPDRRPRIGKRNDRAEAGSTKRAAKSEERPSGKTRQRAPGRGNRARKDKA